MRERTTLVITCRTLGLFVLGLLVGCSSSSSSPNGGPSGAKDGGAPGTERHACYPNGTCNSGLSCLSDLCVRGAAGTGGRMGASGGATASGGSPNIGGTTSTGGAGGNASTLDGGAGASTAGTGGSAVRSDASIDGATSSDSGSAEAGSGGTLCRPGHYVGTFSCDLTSGDAGTSVYSLLGPIDLRLSQAQGGKVLMTAGTLSSAAGVLQLSAPLDGQLSCRSGAFDATFQNGTIAIPPFPPTSGFAGTLSGGFVQSGPKLAGRWSMLGNGSFAGYACSGPWSATWQPG